MLFLFILLALFLLSIVFLVKKNNKKNSNSLIFSLALISVMVISVVLLIIPLTRIDDKLTIEKIKRTKLTIENSRKNCNETERAAILNKIIDINSKIAKMKYINSTFLGDIFVVDELANMDYLE